ncbi:MAG: ABC transporter ATP-binding protein [Pseudomonadota bacterium]
MTTVLSLQNVCLDYKSRTGAFRSFRHRALDDITFDIEQGETFGVLGKNGSGKSSLLLVLAGLVAPSSGKLLMPDGAKSRSLLTLGLGFRPDLTGADNVVLSLVLQGKSKKEARALLPSIEEFSEIGEFFRQPVRTYSTGMRARLGFATGICSEVDILLIDEVLSVGDAQFRQKAENVMMERLGGHQTVIFVSQAPPQIESLCGRALWIHDGKIESLDTAEHTANAYSQFARQQNFAQKSDH